jgi:serine/threonine protein kinase
LGWLNISCGLILQELRVNEEGLFLNRFRIVEPLARGGQGEIFVAEDKSEGELCILKVYDRSITEKEQARIIRLADLVGKLKHPGILCARECVFGASFSVVYPFIKGGALSVKAPSEGKFQEMKQVECYAIQMCHILDFLHGENIVHRDIKPDNFLFDEKGRVFLTDFDFAIFPRWDNYVTLFNKRVRCQGTSLYMAPEQFKSWSSPYQDGYLRICHFFVFSHLRAVSFWEEFRAAV